MQFIRGRRRLTVAGGAVLAAFATVFASFTAAPAFAAEPIQETVYIESEMDSDGDGRLDRITAVLIRPGDTGQVASIVRPSPYYESNVALRGSDYVDPIADPAVHFGSWIDEYFVPRGYAVVEVEMQGTASSDGCISVGGADDTTSVKAVVDWLNGRTTATYADGSPAVASWSTGSVGMYGVSYDGTLPIALAETGVPGLKTIVPVGAISSWYDYTRASGIGYVHWGNRYMQGFANRRSSPRALELCGAKYQQIGDSEADDTNDYTPFYAERNFRDQASQITASVFLVHGQQDWNVKTTQSGRYWNELVANNVPRKLYLHDGEHLDPFWSDLTGRDQVGRWMDYWLYNIDNGVMDEPQATIIRPDGQRDTDAVWPPADAAEVSLHFGPNGTLTPTPASGSQQFTDLQSQTESEMTADPQTAKPNRLAFLTPVLTSEHRLSGIGRVHVTFTADSTSTPLSALLVEYRDGQPVRIVTRGAIDTKNRDSLSTPTPLVPGQQATATVELEPKDYVFAAGSRLGVVVVANNNQYIDVDPLAGQVTVQFGVSRAVLPLAIAPGPVCTDPAWNAQTVYLGGDIVSHNGKRWEAQWWTQNQEPGTSQWGPWRDLGFC